MDSASSAMAGGECRSESLPRPSGHPHVGSVSKMTEDRIQEGTAIMRRPYAESRWRRLRRSEFPTAMLFISPWIIGFLWFQLFPILSSLYYSVTSYNLMQPPAFVGLSNFSRLFGQD